MDKWTLSGNSSGNLPPSHPNCYLQFMPKEPFYPALDAARKRWGKAELLHGEGEASVVMIRPPRPRLA